MSRICRIFVAAGLAVPLVTPAALAEDMSLYKRLGGYDAIAAVTDDFLAQLMDDPEFSVFFVGLSTDSKKRVRQNVVDFLCENTGGPCFYNGIPIEEAHAGLGISAEQWQRSVDFLGTTLNKLDVPEQEQKDLAALMEPLRQFVVEEQ